MRTAALCFHLFLFYLNSISLLQEQSIAVYRHCRVLLFFLAERWHNDIVEEGVVPEDMRTVI